MPINPRVLNAFRAMKEIGIDEAKTKPVLKRLLKLYDKNWELIEEENYRVLADAIFDEDDACTKVVDKKKRMNADEEENLEEETQGAEEPERPLKRLRLRGRESHLPSPSNDSPNMSGPPLLKKPKVEEDGLPEKSEADQCYSRHVDKGKEPISPLVSRQLKRPITQRASHGVQIREPMVEAGIVILPKQKKMPETHALIKPKDEPFTDDMPTNNIPEPLAVIHLDPSDKGDSSVQYASAPQCIDGATGMNGVAASSCDLATVPEVSPPNLEIASSPLGEVKISLSCNSSALGRPDFHMPSRDAVIKYMEEKCLRSYKIFDPSFSVMKLLSDMCECFLELGTDSADKSQEGSLNMATRLDVRENPTLQDALGVVVNREHLNLQSTMDGSVSPPAPIPLLSRILGIPDSPIEKTSKDVTSNGHAENDGKGPEYSEPSVSHSLVIVPQCQITPDELRRIHDVGDITKGEEKVRIAWINEINSEHLPSFHYIPRSLIFQNASVNVSLSRIVNDNCCPTCFGDCLTSSIPCACARETGGKYAYTSDGLINEEFLEECISLNCDTQRKNHFCCKECPLERAKTDDCLEPCKGHLERKLIKECWSKCGCNKMCGNRVVQRGITYKLQVFLTPEGKGWGLRTLEELPKGAFVCEYAGEILTNMELYQRKMEISKTGKHAYPVLLDAYWGSGVGKDEKALCLDATYYGNVARFINHRCLDANLVEIAVEIETPDHHYYHLAFFTTRKVDAFEELTWDYGIDFDDCDRPFEAFQCLCFSRFCRNIKRSNKIAGVAHNHVPTQDLEPRQVQDEGQ